MGNDWSGLDVAIIRWPTEAAKRDLCRAAGTPRLLVLEGFVAAPVSGDVLEDWVRPPLTPEDFRARAGALRARAGAPDRPVIDRDNVLWHRGRRLQLSPTESRLMGTLAASIGEVVDRRSLVRACWPTSPAVRRNALDLHILRLRRRITALHLMIGTLWGRGYVLEQVPPRG
ncbi:helix-turn-helix domain-containing protein [Longispora sp. NPDC051575]|uniref:winged helix-turn-helix domain-containing protein n=1 Tax=Longispora sp. NPDC051575 TaxID=3154943 RepID=UPI0034313FD3